jgi:hypothetical protein
MSTGSKHDANVLGWLVGSMLPEIDQLFAFLLSLTNFR